MPRPVRFISSYVCSNGWEDRFDEHKKESTHQRLCAESCKKLLRIRHVFQVLLLLLSPPTKRLGHAHPITCPSLFSFPHFCKIEGRKNDLSFFFQPIHRGKKLHNSGRITFIPFLFLVVQNLSLFFNQFIGHITFISCYF
jgi:hypothetical protein